MTKKLENTENYRNTKKICKVLECKNKARCKGYCMAHYEAVNYHREQINGKTIYVKSLVIDKEK